jgi:hypothetical protein
MYINLGLHSPLCDTEDMGVCECPEIYKCITIYSNIQTKILFLNKKVQKFMHKNIFAPEIIHRSALNWNCRLSFAKQDSFLTNKNLNSLIELNPQC